MPLVRTKRGVLVHKTGEILDASAVLVNATVNATVEAPDGTTYKLESLCPFQTVTSVKHALAAKSGMCVDGMCLFLLGGIRHGVDHNVELKDGERLVEFIDPPGLTALNLAVFLVETEPFIILVPHSTMMAFLVSNGVVVASTMVSSKVNEKYPFNSYASMLATADMNIGSTTSRGRVWCPFGNLLNIVKHPESGRVQRSFKEEIISSTESVPAQPGAVAASAEEAQEYRDLKQSMQELTEKLMAGK
jgi:hypothetical protein